MSERTMYLADAFLAATATVLGLTNVTHFAGIGITVIDPSGVSGVTASATDVLLLAPNGEGRVRPRKLSYDNRPDLT